jgi:hypothetical protein
VRPARRIKQDGADLRDRLRRLADDVRASSGPFAADRRRAGGAERRQGRPDRLLLPPCPETVIAHLAAYRLGAKGRALIVTGAGRAFCCGAHLKYVAGPETNFAERFDTHDRYFDPIARLFDRLEALSIPVIAAINGFAPADDA